MSQTLQNYECMAVFEEYLTNPHTRKLYLGSFGRFLSYTKITDPSYFLRLQSVDLYDVLKKYLLHLRKRSEQGTLKVNSIRIEFAGIVHFFTYNDIVVNWKKLYKIVPQNVKSGGEKAYTRDQIHAMLAITSKVRNKFLILFMASTGARVGSIPNLKLKHLQKIEDCYYVILYNDEKEEYVSFMTPECSRLFEQYLQTRKTEGEVLTNESPLFRHDYATGKKSNQSIGSANIYNVIARIIQKSGILRNKKGHRYDIAADHGFRKFFATAIKSSEKISYSVSERLLGHEGYLEKSYFLPDVERLFTEYKKTISALTIDVSEIQREEIRCLKAEKTTLEKVQEDNVLQAEKIGRLEAIINGLLEKISLSENGSTSNMPNN